MRAILIILALAIDVSSFSQNADTTIFDSPSIFSIKTDSLTGMQTLALSPQPGQFPSSIAVRGNISIAVNLQKPSLLENQIVDLESEECGALQKRDRVALQRLWGRDFTLDTKQSQLVVSDTPLPNYLSFGRLIERITIIDSSTVFTSGYETFQEFKSGVTTTPLTIRKYFHAWTRPNGLWKLTTKMHQ